MTEFPDSPEGINLRYYQCLDSTNSEALRLIASGEATNGLVIVAGQQTTGRGRRDAKWESPPGNLYMTVVWALPDHHIVGQVAYVTALAIHDAVSQWIDSKHRLVCKWPNDLLLNGKKLSGVLIETQNDWCLVGIGLNLEKVPEEVSEVAISLTDVSATVSASKSVSGVVSAFGDRLEEWKQHGFDPVREAWLERAHGIGAEITARFPSGDMERGKFRGIDGTGALVLERDGGDTRKIAAAEIFFSN